MNKKIVGIFICMLLIITAIPVVSTTNETNNGEITRNTNLDPSEWTIMILMNGDNTLEPAGIDDFLEMSSVGSTNDVNILVQFDRIPGFSDDYDNWNTTKRYLITKDMTPDNANATMDLGEINMGDPQTAIDFFNWAMDNYPANYYCMILWDHGTGWKAGVNEGFMKSVSEDWTDDDKIILDELKSVFEIISDNGDNQVDLIGFDACLMQMIEVAYELSNYGKYMTGSEESETIDGWTYDVFLSNLISDPAMSPENLGEEIVNAYEGLTISTIDLGMISDLTGALSDFGGVLQNEENKEIIYSLAKTTKKYNFPDYRDLFDFTEKFIIYQDMINNPDEIIQKARTVQMKINETVTSTKNLASKSHGISIYLPIDVYYPPYDTLLIAMDTQWDEFLKWLCNGQTGNPPEAPVIFGSTSIKIDKEYEYTFIATDPDGDDVFFRIDWGDGNRTNWIGPISSGEELNLNYTWYESGTCCISAICRDSYSQYSDTSILLISISKSKIISNMLFEQLLSRFPIFEKILNQIT